MPYINDRIHGSIEISQLAQSIIDTSEFQRLRRICQAGVLKWIFPSANHSRFEHSIGVYHLAKTFSKNLTWDLNIKNKERLVELIGTAGLVHDLGHLAFSHLFESYLKDKGTIFHHEELSQNLFRKICKDYNIKINQQEIDFVIELIHPSYDWEKGYVWEGKNIGKWVYQIVASPITGIDVDKFDYLIRDSISCGIKVSFDFDRIIKMSKIINGELIFPWKLRFNIFDMYLSRYQLHQSIYHHKTVLSLELLIIKILEKLDDIYDFKKMISEYNILPLTDEMIFKYDNEDIKKIIFRIETRDFPKSCSPDKAKYLIPVTNALCSEKENPLCKIKYLNKNGTIIYANITDYGILASNNYEQKVLHYFLD